MGKNLHNDPNSLDFLLKQAYLKLDENKLSNQKLYNMTANSILTTGPLAEANSKKETELFNKLNSSKTPGFLSSGKTWIGITCLSLITALAIYSYMHFKKSDAAIQKETIVASYEEPLGPDFETNIFPILRDSVMPKTDSHTLTSEINYTKTPVVQTPKDNSTPASTSQSISAESAISLPAGQNANKTNSDTDDIPTLTEDDKKQNKKRKEALIKYIVKPKKMEWIKINPNQADMTQELYMNAVEITNIQYKTFLMDLIEQNRIDDYKMARVKNSMWKEIGIAGFENLYFYNKKYENNAVVNISPDGMKMYCEWFSELVNASKQNKSGAKYNFRLPTEKEWKFACTSKEIPDPIYTDGLNVIINQRSCMLANFKPLPQNGEVVSNPNYRCDDSTKFVTGNDKYCTKLNDSTLYYVVMVYAFNPSYRGLYCMAGNVSEVVIKENGKPRTIGGNWNSTSTYLKVNAPDEFEGKPLQNPFVGFRIVYTKQ